VYASHDRRHRERQLDTAKDLAWRRSERIPCLDSLRVDTANSEFGEAHPRGESEQHGCEDTRHEPDTEEHDGGDEVDERGHRLHEVEHGLYCRAHSVVACRPDAERDRDDDRNHRSDKYEREREHRIFPLRHPNNEGHRDRRADRELPGAYEPRYERENENEQRRRHSDEPLCDGVGRPPHHEGDEVEEPAKYIDEPIKDVRRPITDWNAEEVVHTRLPSVWASDSEPS